MPLPLLSDAFAIYACDSFGDDTTGYYVWERLTASKDLTKGDGVTAGTFPTLTSNAGHAIAYYVFDGVDDYLSNWPVASGSGYFVSAAFSDSYPGGQPYVTQVTDDSIETLLTTSGSFTGNLHSLILFETEPTTDEKQEIADYQLRQMWREQWVDPYIARLIRSGECVLYCDFEHPEDLYNDYAGVSTLTPSGLDWDHGLLLGGAGTKLTASDDASLRLAELSLFVATEGILTGIPLLEKAGNYKLDNAVFHQIGFNGTYFSAGPVSSPGMHSITVTAKSAESLSLYWDGDLHDTETPVTISDSGTADVVLGDSTLSGVIYRVAIFSRVLSAEEVELLHHSTLLARDGAANTVRARILDVDGDDIITGSQTNVVISCINAGSATGKVWITDEPVFSESSVQTEQTSIDSWTNNSIQFDVDDTGF